MEPRPENQRAPWWKYPIGMVAVLAPFAFFWPLDRAPTRYEYELNAWLVGYTGEYFRRHGAFPETLQTADRVGNTTPIFYGHVLFKAAGVLSLFGGPHLAIRLVAGLCFACAYVAVRHTLRRFGATEGLAALAGCAVCWATYPLTNLYNRFAFAEFTAASFLTCSCCLWLVFFLAPRRETGWLTALAAGFFLTLAAGTHPITGMLGVPFLALVYPLQWTVPVAERPGLLRRHAAVGASAALALAVLAPWLFAYAKVGKLLAISHSFVPGLGYFEGPPLTAALIRLAPIPMDYQHFNPESERLGVAHLDAQANVPLLLAAALALAAVGRALSWARRGHLAGALAPLVALGLAAFAVSVYRTGFGNDSALSRHVPSFLWKMQFSYRLVAAINLAVLLVLAAALAYRRAVAPAAGRLGLRPTTGAVLATVCAAGFMVKLVNGKDSITVHPIPLTHADPGYERWLLEHECLAAKDYVTGLAPRLTDAEAERFEYRPFPVGTGGAFGRVLPLTVAADGDVLVGTQAVPFKWHTFLVDGEPVPPERLRVWEQAHAGEPAGHEAHRVAVPVPPGEHTIEFRFTPPAVWSVLNALAPPALACWFVGLVTAAGLRAARGGARADGREPACDSVPAPPVRTLPAAP
jgi:hypothetical protein